MVGLLLFGSRLRGEILPRHLLACLPMLFIHPS
jgi:hypothetical protein